MNIHAIDEVVYVVTEIIGENSSLVSKRHIEEYILADPSLFPVLAGASQKSRRNIISQVMNARYGLWNDRDRPKKRNFVWNMHQKKGVA